MVEKITSMENVSCRCAYALSREADSAEHRSSEGEKVEEFNVPKTGGPFSLFWSADKPPSARRPRPRLTPVRQP